LTVPQCISYALNRPAVDSAFIGFDKVSQVDDAVVYFSSSEEALEYTDILSSITGDIAKRCLYCNHCLPCSSRIDIARVSKLYDSAKTTSKNDSLQAEYDSLSVKASACSKCGECMNRCPFGVDIVENMRQASELFCIIIKN